MEYLHTEKGASYKTEEVSPIHAAAKAGQKSSVEFLLEKGASIESKISEGRTPIFSAAEGNSPEMVTWLANISC